MAIKKEYAGAAFTGFIVASLFFCGCKNSLEEKVRLGNGVEKEEHSIPQYIHEGVDAYIPMPNSYYEK